MLMVLMTATLWAQRTVVSGKVVDESNGSPIAGASVSVEGVSVVTNDDGFFTLKSDHEAEAVVVSHVGYKSQRVKVGGQELKIKLKPATIKLHEVLITDRKSTRLNSSHIATSRMPSSA